MTRTEGTAAAARQLVGASRPLSWVNTAYPFAAAYLMAGGGSPPSWWWGRSSS